MSYRYQSSYQAPKVYQDEAPQRRRPSAQPLMVAMLVTFVVVSLLVLLAGRMPFSPEVLPLQGPTYREYVERDRARLGAYGWEGESRNVIVHIPVERAMDRLVERGLPTVVAPAEEVLPADEEAPAEEQPATQP